MAGGDLPEGRFEYFQTGPGPEKNPRTLTEYGDFPWRSGRDSNPRTAYDRHTISSRARYDLFDTAARPQLKFQMLVYYTSYRANVK